MEETGSNFIFEGIHVGQTPNVQKYFKIIIKEFDNIIEIGTDVGGFTLFLFKNMKENCNLISYDINPSVNKVPKEYNINFKIGDCFLEPSFSEIKKIISEKSKRVLLLCDGGNKNIEFNVFSDFLKENDVIMCHDFSESLTDFNIIKEKLDWCHPSESSFNEINNSIIRNNLERYYYDEFKSVLWGSFIKI